MQTKKLIPLILIVLLAACSSAPATQPTAAPTTAPTLLPSPTIDPFAAALEKAKSLRTDGKPEQALAALETILRQAPNGSPAASLAVAEVIAIADDHLASADRYYANIKQNKNPQLAYDTYQKALTAYEIILKLPSPPTQDLNQMYLNAAHADIMLMEQRHNYADHYIFHEVLPELAGRASLYAPSPEAQKLFAAALAEHFDFLVIDHYRISPEEVRTAAEGINQRAGNLPMDGQTLADHITYRLLQAELCAKGPVNSDQLATSQTKKAFNCTGQTGIESAGVFTTKPAEIWYVVDREDKIAAPLNCNVTYDNRSYTYTYPGQSTEIFVLRDARSGKLLSNKAFLRTPSRCVFNDCSLDPSTSNAYCSGGEGQSTIDPAALTEWLQKLVQ
ncbi:MAG: hypothetical protein HGA86_07510 [Anaerolineaceae bacterium]|nr:hypothetical protein [Anaerolineaceae bacterium]